MARAYVAGDLDGIGIHPGDPYPLLRALGDVHFRVPPPRTAAQIARSLGTELLRPPPPPPQETLPRWRRVAEGLRHSKERDAEAISHHYDVSNAFYEHVLGPSMTYTCACYPHEGATLEEAQDNKYRLVFDKLRLKAGDRLLDIGCGWGGMVRYAARRGVRVIGATLSAEQAQWAQEAIEREGLGDLARGAAQRLPRRARERVRRGVLDRAHRAHRGAQLPLLLPVRLRPAAARRAGAQPLHHPARQPPHLDRRLHRPLRLPRRRAHRLGDDHQGDAGHRPRGAPRGEPPRALRPHPRRLVRQPARQLGRLRRPRSGRRRRAPGVSTWPARGWASSATSSSSTRCSPSSSATTARRDLPLRPWWDA